MAALVDDATAPSVFVARLAACRDELIGFEPERYEPAACVELAESLSALAKSCEVAAVRAAARAAACGAHRALGHADSHDWVAAMSGTTSSAAREALRTVADVDECPDTRDALKAGEVSVEQAGEIVRAEREAPGGEHELLETAKTQSLGAVRTRARARRLEAIDREELRAKQHAAREIRHWTDELGMIAGSFRLEPVAGTRFVKRLERETDRQWLRARREGRNDSRHALAADAFCELVDADGSGDEPGDDLHDTLGAGASSATSSSTGLREAATSAPTRQQRRRRSVNADVVIVQSAEALRRGHVHPGEVCHVVGGGPVAPSEVEELIARGAFVKAVLHDGKQVTHVAHFGRNLTAEMRTALGLGPPPTFDGLQCTEDGCERRLGLEIDHLEPVAIGGATSLENLDPKCIPHHGAKTRRDRAAGLFDQGP